METEIFESSKKDFSFILYTTFGKILYTPVSQELKMNTISGSTDFWSILEEYAQNALHL